MAGLPEFKSQYVWVVVLIVFLFPAFFPIGAPFPTSEITVKIHDLIESLPSGSIVVIGGGGVFAFDLESSAATIPAVQQMARKGLRVVSVPLWVESVQLEKYVVDAARVDEKYGGPWKYGVDYVQLPYIPGDGAAIVSFLNDVWGTVRTDINGIPFEQLPLMNDLRDYKDIALWICPHWDFPTVVRYATGERGIPSISFAQSGAYATYSPYMTTYPDKVFMTNGFIGGAQYERLEGVKGLGHAVIDSYAILSAVFLVFVVLGNIRLLSSVSEEEKKK